LPKHEIFFLVFSYLLGSIPFGYIIFYLTEKKDIREQGSGNIGAANVLRIKGRAAGIAALVLDMLKGMVPILYGSMHFDSPIIVMVGGAVAVLGHMFPVYLGFRGGKGIASFVGMFIAFHFPSVLAFAAVFLMVLYLTRYVSAASLSGAVVVFFITLFTRVAEISMIVLGLMILIFIKHRANLKRIADGTENRFAWPKAKRGIRTSHGNE
jgi:glycerol-3-phosphate acyltransferase PlsY